jgi:hypothetical protein
MTFAELKHQALSLSEADRQQLFNALAQSLHPAQPSSVPKSSGIAARLIGIAKTDLPAPTDTEVQVMLDERLAEK